MKKILLNYLPPADIYTPSAALSILKSFMEDNGFETEVKYWNFLFKPIVPIEVCDKTEANILPFLSLLNDQNKHQLGNKKAVTLLKDLLVEDANKGNDYFHLLLEEAKNNIHTSIENELRKIDFEEILLFGVSSKFHQWIPGMILSQEIKKTSPHTKTIVGGFGSKEAAMEAMRLNPDFDFATWGEGEYPLLELAKTLQEGSSDFETLPRLVYRKENKLKVSLVSGSQYLDLENYLFPDYEDYFRSYPEPDKKYKIIIPINSTRACFWNKCKFCDYNKGYKYRARRPECIVKEIEYITSKYRSVCFSFVDNDIFANPAHFEKLLDLMIESIEKYNYDYEFWAEMIPNSKLDAALINKMQIAGFSQIFIGYDGITDTLLSKMGKSNTFSDNLFFVKYAMKYGIDPLVNIIEGTIDETKEDVVESSDNLHFLRFFYNETDSSLYHDYATLVISRMTKYYSLISEEEKDEYDKNDITALLPPHFSNHKDRFSLFRWQKTRIDHANQWNLLREKENYYQENRFTYQLSPKGKQLRYTEFINGEIIQNIELEKDHWDTLKLVNNKVTPFEDLLSGMKDLHPQITTKDLQAILTNLKDLHILYCNNEFSNVIGVVDLR